MEPVTFIFSVTTTMYKVVFHEGRIKLRFQMIENVWCPIDGYNARDFDNLVSVALQLALNITPNLIK